jgi:hypothetical protein
MEPGSYQLSAVSYQRSGTHWAHDSRVTPVTHLEAMLLQPL